MTTYPARQAERGQILLVMVLSTTVLLGVAALSIDASFMYDQRNILSAAADAAAKSAASEVLRRPSTCAEQATLDQFAAVQINANGVTFPATGTTMVVHCPPDSGPFAGNLAYVEARVSHITPTFFGRIVGFTSVTPNARAVAGPSPSPNCLMTLLAGAGITVSDVSGLIDVTAPLGPTPPPEPQCLIVDGGDLTNNGAIAGAQAIGVTGTCLAGCAGVLPNQPPPLDPLVNLPVPSLAECNGGLPGTDVAVAGPTPIMQGTYRNLQFKGGTLTMDPGLYCFTGTIDVSALATPVTWTATGGVTIYLAPGATMTLNSSLVTATLPAQTVGAYRGILLYQDRMNANTALLAQDAGTWTIDGAMYLPAANVHFANAHIVLPNKCGIIIAGSLETARPSFILKLQCGTFGGSPIPTVSIAE